MPARSASRPPWIRVRAYVSASCSSIQSDVTTSGGNWTYTRWNGDVFTFNSSGQLTSEADRNGNTLTLITCYPFGFVGQALERFVVRAVEVR